MKTVTLNFDVNAIEISETFAKKARVYKSPAYDELMQVQKDHPTFKIVVVKSMPKKNTSVKGIDYVYMRKYIESHDESKELLQKFDKMTEGKTPFFEVKNWFLDHYPELKKCKTKADWVLAA
jgi:hypothetical protein